MESAAPSSSLTQTQIVNEPIESPSVSIKLRKPARRKKVKWSSKTIDNENMGKKKSKCCCIYTKPEKFGDPSVLSKKHGDSPSSSSDSSEDQCNNCHGHRGKDFLHGREHSDYSSCDDHESREKTPPITFAKVKVLPLTKINSSENQSNEHGISTNKEDIKSKESSKI